MTRGSSSSSIGLRMRALREAASLSLGEVSTSTGLSRSFLSQVERGLSAASVESLRAIASALGVPLTRLLEDWEAETSIVRAGERPRLRGDGDGLQYSLLSGSPQRAVLMLLTEIPPHSASASRPMSHLGEECAFVLKGSVRIEFMESEIEVHEGDAVYMRRNVPHRMVNDTDGVVIMVSAVAQPGF